MHYPFGKEILSRETNIKIAPEFMESTNPLTNMKQPHEKASTIQCCSSTSVKDNSHST